MRLWWAAKRTHCCFRGEGGGRASDDHLIRWSHDYSLQARIVQLEYGPVSAFAVCEAVVVLNACMLLRLTCLASKSKVLWTGLVCSTQVQVRGPRLACCSACGLREPKRMQHAPKL